MLKIRLALGLGLGLCAALFAQSALADDQIHATGLDALCAAGKKLSAGCDAIRAREILDAKAAPWRAIGRVNYAGLRLRSHCTGTLVSERVVLTAAHCLYNSARKRWIPAESVRFAAGYDRGTAVAVSQVERYMLDPQQDSSSAVFKRVYATDWALLVLKDPIGRETGFATAVELTDQDILDGGFMQAGYAGLRPHVMSLATDCDAANRQDGVVYANCSTMRGDSGSALLKLNDGKLSVFATLSAVSTRGSRLQTVSVPVATFRDALDALINN